MLNFVDFIVIQVFGLESMVFLFNCPEKLKTDFYINFHLLRKTTIKPHSTISGIYY